MIAAASFIVYVLGMLLISQTKSLRQADVGCALVALAIIGAGIVGLRPFDVSLIRVGATLAIAAIMVFLAYRQYRWHWCGLKEAYDRRRRESEVTDLSQDVTTRIDGGAR